MDDITVDLERAKAVDAPLATALRRLIDAAIMTNVDEEASRAARSLVEDAADLLERQRLSGNSFGLRHTTTGAPAVWGNVAIGLRNPIAPPLTIARDECGRVSTRFELGSAYEGPPGCVHGGVCALIMDHVLAATAHEPGSPAVTGTLTIRFLRPTRLGSLTAEAWRARQVGDKTFAAGNIADEQGVTVEAEGVFIHIREERGK